MRNLLLITFPSLSLEPSSTSVPAVSTSVPSTPSVSTVEEASSSSSAQVPKEEGGDGKQPIVIDLEAMAKVQKEPEVVLPPPEKEEPFVPEEEPTEKTWLGKSLPLLFFLPFSSFLLSFF